MQTEEGVRFTDGFGGLAAYCHWPFEYYGEQEEGEGALTDDGHVGGAPSQVAMPPPPGLAVGPGATTTLRADAPSWDPAAAAELGPRSGAE